MKIVSHHAFRRTARKREHALERIENQRLALEGGPRRYRYYVERSKRGPFGWRVVEARTRPHAAGSPSPVAGPEAL